MESEERQFWVFLSIFSALFGTGPFIISQSVGWGLFYTIVGLGGLVMLIRDRLRLAKERVKISIRTPLKVMASIGISVFVAQFMFYVFSLRADMNRYVVPRTLTKEEADKLQKALSATPPDVKVNILAYVADQEAMTYAEQLTVAIKAGGWDPQFQPVNPWDPKHQPESYILPYFPILDQGLMIRSCMIGQPTNPDPKHPDSFILLKDALNKAGIEVDGDSQNADCGKYSLDVEVGRRPFRLGEQPTVLQRLGSWLLSRGQ